MIRYVSWRPRHKPRRIIRLYRAWDNLKGRVSGRNHDGRGNARWAGLSNEFTSWEHFREWALGAGFSKELCSLDRIDSSKGYSPGNCQWLTKADQCRKAVSTKQAT